MARGQQESLRRSSASGKRKKTFSRAIPRIGMKASQTKKVYGEKDSPRLHPLVGRHMAIPENATKHGQSCISRRCAIKTHRSIGLIKCQRERANSLIRRLAELSHNATPVSQLAGWVRRKAPITLTDLRSLLPLYHVRLRPAVHVVRSLARSQRTAAAGLVRSFLSSFSFSLSLSLFSLLLHLIARSL